MAFDPDKFLAKKRAVQKPVETPPKPDKSFLEQAGEFVGTAAEQLGESVSFGLTTPAQAAVGKLIEGGFLDPSKDIDEQLREQGIEIKDKDRTFGQLIEQAEKRQEQQFEESPVATVAGQAAGLLIPGAAVAKGAQKVGLKAAKTVGGRVATGVGTAFTAGALERPEGEEIPFSEPVERLEQGFKAAPFGLAGPALEQVGRGIQKATGATGKNLVLKALGLKKSTFDKITAKGTSLSRADDVVEELTKRNIVRPGEDVLTASRRLNIEIKKTGRRIKKLYQNADDFLSKPENVAKLSGQQRQRLRETSLTIENIVKEAADDVTKKFGKNPFGEEAAEAVAKRLTKLKQLPRSKTGEINIADLQEFRRGLDVKINFDSPEGKTVNDAFKTLRNTLKRMTQERVSFIDGVVKTKGLPDKFTDPKMFNAMAGSVDDLRALNKSYRVLADADVIAKSGVSSDLGNLMLGLGPTITGTGAGVAEFQRTGDPARAVSVGLGVGLGTRFLRRRGPSLAGPALLGASKVQMSPSLGVLSDITAGRLGERVTKEKKK